MHSRRRFHAAVPRIILGIAAFFCVLALLDAAWIPAKAQLAQFLIARNWQAVQSGDTDSRPWPWADTRAAARLTVPSLQRRLYVLEGDSGRNLAFGPALSPGSSGGLDRVIHGHRDTHFAFLDRLRPGDRLQWQAAGEDSIQWFEIVQTEVIDSRRAEMVIEPGVERLSLVTCYPLDSPLPGGPLRYVVTALPVNALTAKRPPASG